MTDERLALVDNAPGRDADGDHVVARLGIVVA